MELWIHKGQLYQRIDNEEGEEYIKLYPLGWLPVSECEAVSFSDIQHWYRSSVFELDVML